MIRRHMSHYLSGGVSTPLRFAVGMASVAVAIALTNPSAADAQLTRTFPGHTSAALPDGGAGHSAVDFSLHFSSIAPEDTHSWLSGMNVSWSRAYRVGESAELGFAFSWLDISYQNPTSSEDEAEVPRILDAHALYGITIGGKYRIMSFIDLDGLGTEASVFVTHRPGMRTVASMQTDFDSTVVRGILGGSDEEGEVFGGPRSNVPSHSQVGMVVDYTAARFELSGGLIYNSGSGDEEDLLNTFSGVSPNLAARYRLNPGSSLGFVFWGNGSPPWASEAQIQGLRRNTGSVGLLIGFGPGRLFGSDLILSTPVGSLGESVRILYSSRGLR